MGESSPSNNSSYIAPKFFQKIHPMQVVYSLKEGDIIVSTDPDSVDKNRLFNFLHNTAYWSKGIPRETFEISLENSRTYSALKDDEMIGFARVVTDRSTFLYLADVYVEPEHRGKGYSKILMRAIMGDPAHKDIRTWILLTSDAQGLYEQFGWKYFDDRKRIMRFRSKPDHVPFYE